MTLLRRSSRVPLDPVDGAVWWAARRSLMVTRISEEAAFARWLSDPGHREAWLELDGMMQHVGRHAASPTVRQLRAAALTTASAKAATSPLRLGALAASLAAALLAFCGWFALQNALPSTASERAIAYQRFTTKVGETRAVRIGDGSIVTLNTASAIKVHIGTDRREVILLSGQALFDVAKDPARPFTVTAADRQVTALGTLFDVRLASGGGMSVLLAEGKVEVDPIRRTGISQFLPVLARDVLSPGQRLTSPGISGGSIAITADDIARDLSWRDGRLIFRDDTLGSAVAEMNRFSTSKILIGDSTIAALTLSGVFTANRPRDFLAAVTTFFPLNAHKRGADVTVLEWRSRSE